ncbi:MAG: hypothetical protein D6814_06105, partial [Calditrichaeota bacterium]
MDLTPKDQNRSHNSLPPRLPALQRALKEILIYFTARPDLEPRQKDELNRLIARLESPLQERDAPAIEKQVRELLFALEALDHQEAPRREQALRRLAKSLLELCNRDESEQNPYRDELKDMGDR